MCRGTGRPFVVAYLDLKFFRDRFSWAGGGVGAPMGAKRELWKSANSVAAFSARFE
jgi:hypothetical protein